MVAPRCGCTVFRTACRSKNAGRLALTVTDEERFLFLRADSSCKFLCNVGRQVENRIIKKFLGDLNRSTDLVSGEGNLTKCIIGEGICLFLFDPACLTLLRDNRDFTVST